MFHVILLSMNCKLTWLKKDKQKKTLSKQGQRLSVKINQMNTFSQLCDVTHTNCLSLTGYDFTIITPYPRLRGNHNPLPTHFRQITTPYPRTGRLPANHNFFLFRRQN